MKVVIFVALLSVLKAEGLKRHYDDDTEVVCGVGGDESYEFRKAIYNFTMHMYKRIAEHTDGHFVISTLSIWQLLAAIAEGSDGQARQQLFQHLGLPEDDCARQSFYQVAVRETSGPDISLDRTRLFFIDEGCQVNNNWQNFALNQFRLLTAQVPIKHAAQQAAFSIRNTINSQISTLNFEGNSVVADSLDYTGLWTEEFPEGLISRSPFYDHHGHQIGSVDLMRTRKRVRLAFVDHINSVVMEIPVGHNGRYRMLFGIPKEGHDLKTSFGTVTNTVIFEIVEKLKETDTPIDIAIPQFLMSTELDVRALLEEIGVDKIWIDSSATGNIAQPPAVPSSFIQKVQVTINSYGVGPNIPAFTEHSATGLDPVFGNAVIVDRPFMYGLFDGETYTCIFAAAYSKPTYGLNG